MNREKGTIINFLQTLMHVPNTAIEYPSCYVSHLENKDLSASALTVQTVCQHAQTRVVLQHCIEPFL